MPDIDVDKLINSYRAQQIEDSDDEDSPKGDQPFVDWNSFNLLVGLVITANALTIGLETDARSLSGSGNVSRFWFLLELLFCFLFVTELALRLYFHGFTFLATPMPRPIPESRPDGDSRGPPPPPPRPSCTDRLQSLPRRLKLWNVTDLLIVVISIIDAILTAVGSGGSARFVSMLRFIRLLRLIRLVRLFKIFKELWLVANGLINAMKTLLWVCAMIFIICYIGGIFTTLYVGHNDEMYDPYFRKTGWDHEMYFSTVPRSLFTLFQVITLDQWSEKIARHVIKNQPAMLIFFLLLICVVTFGLLNIIVGVVVENALSTAAKDQRKVKKAKDRDRQFIFNELREIFQEADKDNSQTLTFQEVEACIKKPEIDSKLRMIDFPVDDPQQIFNLLDINENGSLTIEEFITGCLRMKGTAKSKDLLVAQVALDCMKKHYVAFEQELEKLQAKLHRLDATARAITDHGERVFLDMRQYRMRHPQERGSTIPRMQTMVMQKAPWERPDADSTDEQALALYRHPSDALALRVNSETSEMGSPSKSTASQPGQMAVALRQSHTNQEMAAILGGDEQNMTLAVPGSLDN